MTAATAKITDPISCKRAAKITGYSYSLVSKAAKAGAIVHQRNGRGYVLSRSSALEWAESNRKNGGTHLPRGPRRPKRVVAHTEKAPKGRNIAARLNSYLDRVKGTPAETDAPTFIADAVNIALHKLGY